jgi:hypothetical protein
MNESQLLKLTIRQIAEAFSSHQFDLTYPYISDTIQWHLVGNKKLDGKEEVVSACRESAHYLADVKTDFIKFDIVADNNKVAVNSVAEYIDQEQHSTRVASCDIYRFVEEQLVEITSYCIELN